MRLSQEEYATPPAGWYLDAKSKRLILNTNNGFLLYEPYRRFGVRERMYGFDAYPKMNVKLMGVIDGKFINPALLKGIDTEVLYDYYYLGDNEEFYNLIVDLGEWLPRHSKKGELITDNHGHHYIVSKTYTFDDIEYPTLEKDNRVSWVCNNWRYDNEGNPNECWENKFVEKIFDALEKAGKGLPDGVIAYETYCVETHYREIKTNAYLIDYYDIYDYAKKKHQKAKRAKAKEAKKQLALAS